LPSAPARRDDESSGRIVAVTSTALFSHSACLYHDTGLGHPESADRLRAVIRALETEEFAYLDRREAPPASAEQLARVHAPSYVGWVLDQIPDPMIDGHVHLDGDTVVSTGSGEAALRAAGAVCAAVDAVIAGENRNAFCAVRPPGHHAEPHRAMGFCLFNNVAVGALHARAAHGVERIAVIDFDVHHGNGTEAMFAADPNLLYVSTHQWPLYPGTGNPRDRSRPNIVNVGLHPTAGSADFRAAATDHVLPVIDDFRPDLVMISAGFDAHADDPLAELDLLDHDFFWVTEKLVDLARRHAGGRLVSTLEGGYNLRALASSAAAHVRALMAA
jgi:acetoin utilization deacetylase AcuC-like enzyme